MSDERLNEFSQDIKALAAQVGESITTGKIAVEKAKMAADYAKEAREDIRRMNGKLADHVAEDREEFTLVRSTHSSEMQAVISKLDEVRSVVWKWGGAITFAVAAIGIVAGVVQLWHAIFGGTQ